MTKAINKITSFLKEHWQLLLVAIVLPIIILLLASFKQDSLKEVLEIMLKSKKDSLDTVKKYNKQEKLQKGINNKKYKETVKRLKEESERDKQKVSKDKKKKLKELIKKYEKQPRLLDKALEDEFGLERK